MEKYDIYHDDIEFSAPPEILDEVVMEIRLYFDSFYFPN